jgi:hypothetical protein
MLKVAVFQFSKSLVGHVVKSAAEDLEPVNVKELLERMFSHASLRIMHLRLRNEFVDDPHAAVDELLDKMLFEFFVHT